MSEFNSEQTVHYPVESRQFWSRQEASWLNFVANVLYVFSTVIFLYQISVWVMGLPVFNLKAIEIRSLQSDRLEYIVPDDIKKELNHQLDPYFFKVDIKHIQSKIQTMPWVRDVLVERVWPNKIRINIEEHVPFAYWNQTQMMNTEGEVFTPDKGYSDFQGMVHFYGPDKSHYLIKQRYYEMNQQLKTLGLKVVKIILTERFTWNIFLDNDVKLILAKDQAVELSDGTKLQDNYLSFNQMLSRFIQAWPSLEAMMRNEGKQVISVDLRYMKGFAIKVKDQPILKDRDENEGQR